MSVLLAIHTHGQLSALLGSLTIKFLLLHHNQRPEMGLPQIRHVLIPPPLPKSKEFSSQILKLLLIHILIVLFSTVSN